MFASEVKYQIIRKPARLIAMEYIDVSKKISRFLRAIRAQINWSKMEDKKAYLSLEKRPKE